MNDEAIPPGSRKKPIAVSVDGRQALLILAVVMLCISGCLLRLLPLSSTPYPEMLDGLGEAEYSEHIAATGSITPEAGSAYSETHIVNTPAYDAMTAMSSLIIGDRALFLLQIMLGPFSILLLVGVFVLTQRFSGNHKVALITLMALACYGPFLLITQATWKECIGLCLLPFVLVTFFMRDDLRMRIVSSSLILMMPFVHHYIALLTILMISIASSISFLKARKMKRIRSTNMLDLIISITAIDELILYYSATKLDRLEYLTPENGLYLFIGLAILVSIGVYYLSEKCITDAGKKAMWLTTTVGLTMLFFLNLVIPTGLIDADLFWATSIPVISGIILIIVGVAGISLWAASFGRAKTLFFAMTAAPFIFIVHGVLRAPDVLSLDIITRTLDLIDLSLMIGLATFALYVLKGRSRLKQFAAMGAVCSMLLLTLPIAVEPDVYVGTRNDIFSYEVDAINWTVQNRPDGDIQTDVHYTFARYLFNEPDSSSLVRRLEGTLDIQNDQWMIANNRWTTFGTKDLPYGWVILEKEVYCSVLAQSNVFYIGGPSSIQIVVFESAQ